MKIQKFLFFILALVTINAVNASQPTPPSLTPITSTIISNVGLSPSAAAPSPAQALTPSTPSAMAAMSVSEADVTSLVNFLDGLGIPKVLIIMIINYGFDPQNLMFSKTFNGFNSKIVKAAQISKNRSMIHTADGRLTVVHMPTGIVVSNGLIPAPNTIQYLMFNRPNNKVIASTADQGNHTFSFQKTGELAHEKYTAETATYGIGANSGWIQSKNTSKKPFLIHDNAEFELQCVSGPRPFIATQPNGNFIVGCHFSLTLFDPNRNKSTQTKNNTTINKLRPIQTFLPTHGLVDPTSRTMFCSVAAVDNNRILGGLKKEEVTNRKATYQINLIDANNGQTMRSFDQSHCPDTIAALPMDLFASSCGKTIIVWNVNQNASVHTISDHQAPVTCLCTLDDGRLLSGDQNGIVRISNFQTLLGLALKQLQPRQNQTTTTLSVAPSNAAANTAAYDPNASAADGSAK